jgi:DNA primase
MSTAQEHLLAEVFGDVVLMLDGDDAGRGAASEITDRLQRVVFQVRTVELPRDVQPDQLSADEIHRLLEEVSIMY